MTKLPYREGTWFAVPLERAGFGVGVVARAASKGKIILAYLFGPKRKTVPSLAEVKGLKPHDAVLKIRIGDLGLIRGRWPVIGQSESWKRADWPMPIFICREPLGHGRTWLVYYSDEDPSSRVREEPVSSETSDLERDSLFGSGAAEVTLTDVLTKGGCG